MTADRTTVAAESNMEGKRNLRVLLIGQEATDVSAIEAVSRAPDAPTFSLHRVAAIEAALTQLEHERFDIVMMQCAAEEVRDVEALAKLHRLAPGVPKMLLADPAAAGNSRAANDEYATDRAAFRFAVGQALESRARDEQPPRLAHSREIDGFERMTRLPGTSVTAGLYQGESLRESSSERFAEFVDRYDQQIEAALRERLKPNGFSRSEAMRDLADEMGFLAASPRDVVAVHCETLRRKLENCDQLTAQACIEESRLLLLELMGNVASFYRVCSRGLRREVTRQ